MCGSDLFLRVKLYVTAAFKGFSFFYFDTVKHQTPVNHMDRHKGELLQLESLLPSSLLPMGGQTHIVTHNYNYHIVLGE